MNKQVVVYAQHGILHSIGQKHATDICNMNELKKTVMSKRGPGQKSTYCIITFI